MTFSVITVLIPVLTSVFISCVMDLSCFVMIQYQRSVSSNPIDLENLTEQRNSVNIFNFFSRKNSVHPSPTNSADPPNPIITPSFYSIEIPLRATIISTLLFFLYIFAYTVNGVEKLDPLEKFFFVVTLTRIQDTSRNPLITKFLFNINDQNRRRNDLEERERNRQKEITDALKRRQQRQEAKIANDSRYVNSIFHFHLWFWYF